MTGRILPVTCDRCGAAKRDANHWWKLRPMTRTNGGLVYQVLMLMPFEAARSSKPSDIDLCGQACLAEAISEYDWALPAPGKP